jgi:hypothetical protein
VTVPLAGPVAVKVQTDTRTVTLSIPGRQEVPMPEGEEADKATVPMNPLNTFIVMVVVAMPPTVNDVEAGLALRPKSGVVELVKNSVMGVTAASPVDMVASPQLSSTVLMAE